MSWLDKLFGRPSWSEVAVPHASPREICRLVAKHIRYKSEKKDRWNDALTTWTRGQGDCEDISMCIRELCRISQFDVGITCYVPTAVNRAGHAVAGGTWNGQLWFSNNGSYEEVASAEEIKKRVARVLDVDAANLGAMTMSDQALVKLVEQGRGEAGLPV